MNLLFKESLKKIYGNDDTVIQQEWERFDRLIGQHINKFGEQERYLFSTPGRTELGGNHTDHNNGIVLAASINLDSKAVVSVADDSMVTLYSEGYDTPFEVNLNDLEVQESEKESTESLIRGVAARFVELGYSIGGFKACMTSSVLPGSGLSSSASVEVLFGTIFNALYNEDKIMPETLAKIGQYAENNYFGKPCGLMDQMACAVGGIISIDFKDNENPVINKVDFDFAGKNYKLLVVDTGGSHVDLTDDYASVPIEMKRVAAAFSKTVCHEISFEELMQKMKSLRKEVGDRAVLRVMHFLMENERVLKEVEALKQNDFNQFLELVTESGNSSFKWLQNIYSVKKVDEQGMSLALALTEKFITDISEGACRVHGGGFAGTIQVFLPQNQVDAYIKMMESVFEKDSVKVLEIRPLGTSRIF